MKTNNIPLDVDLFLKKFGNERLVGKFSREAVEVILLRIKAFKEKNPNAECDWQSFFMSANEVWSEGIVIMPREKLKLTDDIARRLDEIKKLRKSKKRCSALVYEVATELAEKNGFTQLTSSRFLI